MILEGKTAIVTGSSRGIGRAIALRFAADGAKVTVNCVTNMDKAETVAGEIHAAGGAAIAVQADVGERADADRLVAETDAATAFLASDYAAYITGQARRVNGGMSMGG